MAGAVLGAAFGLSRTAVWRRSRAARALAERRHADAVRFLLSLGPVWALWATLDRPAAPYAPKALAGLVVVGPGAGPAGPQRRLARVGLKVAPWQLAHLAVAREQRAEPSPRDDVLAKAGFLLSSAALLADSAILGVTGGRRALHDVLAGTRVLPR